VPVGERPGRSFSGKPLTRWFRSFGQPDLFSVLEEADTRPVATMDSCVFFDLVASDPDEVASQLQADWLGEHIRLAVTSHLFQEIADGKDAARRERQRNAAQRFRMSDIAAERWRPIFSDLLSAHPDAPEKDHDDLTHVALSIAGQATWLITSDQAFVQRYGETAERLGGLRILLPSELLREVDEQASGDRYRPSELAGTAVTRREVDAATLEQLPSAFVNHAAGEKISELRTEIRVAGSNPGAVRLQVVEIDDEARGLVAWEPTASELRVPLIRAPGGRASTTVGRHLLGLLRDEAVAVGVETIRITDAFPSAAVRSSFRDEGFTAVDDATVGYPLVGTGTMPELRARLAVLGLTPIQIQPFARDDALAASEAERWFSPYRVLGSGLATFVVPIRHAWATALFDSDLSQGQLFRREWQLGLRRELVYFRSTANSRGLAGPARLLWYVSGQQPGAQAIRAVSQLLDVEIGDHERLFYRYERLAVYRREQVAQCKDRLGRVMALRFSQTELLPYPVPLDRYREIVTGQPRSSSVVLQSPYEIDEHMFVSIMEEGHQGDA
jgi:predicted nucleic acid-binding protein